MVHVLLVKLVMKNAGAIALLQENITDLYRHSRSSEPGTLSYEVLRPTTDPSGRTIFILERYGSKNDLADVHRRSSVFERFSEWIRTATSDGEAVINSLEFSEFDEMDQPCDVERNGATNGVLVFCGARRGILGAYVEAAAVMGTLIAESGRPLVYGAGTMGVMGAVSDACRSAGGRVISVIPRALAPREVAGEVDPDSVMVETMAERKAEMFALSSWVIGLPGGIGTLDELFEVLTLTQLNAFVAKVGLLNTCEFYAPFMAMLHHLVTQGFLEQKVIDQIIVRDTPEELWDAMNTSAEPSCCANLKWTKGF